jgi:hypothetical protein
LAERKNSTDRQSLPGKRSSADDTSRHQTHYCDIPDLRFRLCLPAAHYPSKAEKIHSHKKIVPRKVASDS